MSREAMLAKIERVLGAEAAAALVLEVMQLLGLQSLDTPDARLRFARELIVRGGVFAAIGNSIAVQAILEGGKDARSSGQFRLDLPPRKPK